MRTILEIVGVIVLGPLLLGIIAGFSLAFSMPWLSRWAERKAAKDAAVRSGDPHADWPPIPRPLPPAPKPPEPPVDRRFHRPAGKTGRPN